MLVPARFSSDGDNNLHLSLSEPHQSIESDDDSLQPHVYIEYMNEGGANFIFRFRKTERGESLPPQLDRKLLRLRKDLAHLPSAQRLHEDFVGDIQPLIPKKHLVEQQLVSLEPALVFRLDAVLESSSHASRRQGHALPLEEFNGLLITDMSPKKGEELLLELKPKWLSQSPNAPSGSRRCRTCALRAQRAASGKRTATDAQENCPLALISPDRDHRIACASKLTKDDAIITYLADEAQPVLLALRDRQVELDVEGCLGDNRNDGCRDGDLLLCKAMTLRDCTFFILKKADGTFEAKFADLDLKRLDKIPRWREVETALIEEGWYADPRSRVADESVCLLARVP